jgi:hypothetical protein
MGETNMLSRAAVIVFVFAFAAQVFPAVKPYKRGELFPGSEVRTYSGAALTDIAFPQIPQQVL